MRQVGLHVPVELTNAAAERSLHLRRWRAGVCFLPFIGIELALSVS